MLKTQSKRPVTSLAKKPAPAAPVSPLKKAALKKAPPVEEEVIEEPVEEEAEPEQEEQEAPAPKAKFKTGGAGRKSKSLADMFDSTKPRGFFPVGEFRATITSFELDGEFTEDPDEQGKVVAILKYEGHESEEECAGQEIQNRYNITNDEGELHDSGPGFLKADLVKLGYEESDITLENLSQILDQIAQEQPEVVIKVVNNKGYTNAYLQGRAE